MFDSVFQLFLLLQWLHAAACDCKFLTVKGQRYQIVDIFDLDKDAGDLYICIQFSHYFSSLNTLNHNIDEFQIFCTAFHKPHFLQKRLIFSWFIIFHNRVADESQKL